MRSIVRAFAAAVTALVAGSALAAGASPRFWPPLAAGGAHDPAAEDVRRLQQPGQALRELPPGRGGNQVDWVEALKQGGIQPRAGLLPGAEATVLDLEVPMRQTGSMPHVTFPHLQHTQWLSCDNCHPAIFLPVEDGNPITMYGIVQGEYCGVCHGSVAFPVTDCLRCHDTPKEGKRPR